MQTNTEPASMLHQNPGDEMKKTSNQRQKKQIHRGAEAPEKKYENEP